MIKLDTELSFDPSLWNDLFPFYFATDRQLNIVGSGPSLQKLFPKLKQSGVKLTSLFALRHPRVDLNFEFLVGASNQLLIFETAADQVLLRGQIVPLTETVFFAGSPCAKSPEILFDHGVLPQHFAAYDTTLENLFLKQSQKLHTTNLKNMIDELQYSARERDRMGFVEQALVHDLRAAGDVILRISRAGRILEARATKQEYFSRRPHELVGKNIRLEFHYLLDRFEQAKHEINCGEASVAFDYQVNSGDNTYYFEARLAPTLNHDFLLLARDVTERRELELCLEYRASHDPQTELPNRAKFEQMVKRQIDCGETFSLMFIDLNDFKDINDTHGHQFGDQVIVEIADRLREVLDDQVARLGGDEFGAIVELCDDSVTHSIADLVDRRLSAKMEIEGKRICVSPSIGIASSSDVEGNTVAALFQSADMAMYRAKAKQNCSTVVFEPRMIREYAEKMKLLGELREAIQNSQIISYYQPVVDLQSGRVAGFEALARWNHPLRGVLAPGEFIALAEESGLVVDIGNQLLKAACRDAQELSQRFNGNGFFFNVNISPVQIQDSDLCENVSSALVESGFSPANLNLEITESLFLDDFDRAISVFQQLKQLGVKIALDDFGTGYSSLMYLERLPIDILKLDRSFIRNIDQGTNKRKQLARTIVELGLGLDLRIVAEGIEQIAEQEFVIQTGCKYGQGYLYCRPISKPEIVQFVNAFEMPKLQISSLSN